MWHVWGDGNIQTVSNETLKDRGLGMGGRIILKVILKNTLEECRLTTGGLSYEASGSMTSAEFSDSLGTFPF